MPITSSDISALVEKLMDERSIGYRDLARRMGMSSHSRISDRMKGRATWKLDELFPLAEALNVSPEWILNELQDMERKRNSVATPLHGNQLN